MTALAATPAMQPARAVVVRFLRAARELADHRADVRLPVQLHVQMLVQHRVHQVADVKWQLAIPVVAARLVASR